MSATLRLIRESLFAMELRRGQFDIIVDGKGVGSIERHETVEKPLDPGDHTLQVRQGRYTSRDYPFEVADGEVASFRCNSGRIWPIQLLSFIVPSLALVLRRE